MDIIDEIESELKKQHKIRGLPLRHEEVDDEKLEDLDDI
jgi:hypothetical protein